MEYWIYLYGMAESDASVSDDKMDLPALQKLTEEQFNALLSYRSALVKAEELGFDGLTEVEFSEIQQKAADDLAIATDYYEETLRQKYGSLSEEKLQILLEAELSTVGYSETQLISDYMDSLIYEKIYSYYTNALSLNEAEVEAGAAQLAEQAKENYASDPDRYDYDLFFGATTYYTPANVRRVKHILIALDEEDAAAVQSMEIMLPSENRSSTQAVSILNAQLSNFFMSISSYFSSGLKP